ncbi:hypothetical protein TorRG33x02_118040 [Trema orientale]|uniref:Uncharacterized protein n=1 Tax=Trema orientale TaxID=63057 RepID=A0A2P5F3U9_TREOI|nr:hypothetical protein TorRG33x02_118040 [Trema orientale]
MRCLYRVDQYLRLCPVCIALIDFGSKEVSSAPPPPEDKSSSSSSFSSSSSSFSRIRDYCGVCGKQIQPWQNVRIAENCEHYSQILVLNQLITTL